MKDARITENIVTITKAVESIKGIPFGRIAHLDGIEFLAIFIGSHVSVLRTNESAVLNVLKQIPISAPATMDDMVAIKGLVDLLKNREV